MKTQFLLSKCTVAVLLASLFATSCKNDTELIDLKKAPTAAEFNALRESALQDLRQTKTFKAEEGLEFTSAKGAILSIYPECIKTQAGAAATGDATLTFIEIYDRGTMSLTNKPVMGKDNSGNLLPLVTGGQYNIKITQGDALLKSGCPFHVQIPTANTGGADPEMILWTGTINDEGNLTWEENRGQKEGLGLNEEGTHYNFFDNQFGWTNVDRFYSDSRPKTKIMVTPPTGYNNSNSGVYLSYEGEPNLLAQLDVFNSVDNYFSEHYGFIPIGMNVHVIFISENNGAVTYAIKKVKIAANESITIADSDLKAGTKAQLVNIINGLN